MEDFLGIRSKLNNAGQPSMLYTAYTKGRVDAIAAAIMRGMELRVFGGGQGSLLRWWSGDIREQIPLMQFEHLRLMSMFNVAGPVHRIGDWHVATIRHELVHPDIGPIEYHIAFRAGAGADLFTSGIRVFTTWGTLADQDDPTVTYPGWARPNDMQRAQLDALLAKPSSTPAEIQERMTWLKETSMHPSGRGKSPRSPVPRTWHARRSATERSRT